MPGRVSQYDAPIWTCQWSWPWPPKTMSPGVTSSLVGAPRSRKRWETRQLPRLSARTAWTMNGPGPRFAIAAVNQTYWSPFGATPALTSVSGDIARSGRIGSVGAASGSGSDAGQ